MPQYQVQGRFYTTEGFADETPPSEAVLLNKIVLFGIVLAGWFTTFFKDSVDPDDNFDSRPGANLFIKHVKYEGIPDSTQAATVTTAEVITKPTEENEDITKRTDTESIPFNSMFARKESDNEYVDRKQVDAEEEVLKQLYERGDGGAADGEDTTTPGVESTQAAESPSNRHDCFSKTTNLAVT